MNFWWTRSGVRELFMNIHQGSSTWWTTFHLGDHQSHHVQTGRLKWNMKSFTQAYCSQKSLLDFLMFTLVSLPEEQFTVDDCCGNCSPNGECLGCITRMWTDEVEQSFVPSMLHLVWMMIKNSSFPLCFLLWYISKASQLNNYKGCLYPGITSFWSTPFTVLFKVQVKISHGYVCVLWRDCLRVVHCLCQLEMGCSGKPLSMTSGITASWPCPVQVNHMGCLVQYTL